MSLGVQQDLSLEELGVAAPSQPGEQGSLL